jgi:hypothetical protein
MLNWNRVDDNWRGNGFLIKPSPSREWDLYEIQGEDPSLSVLVEPVPLASLPTLSACKHRAEVLHSQAESAALRSRLAVVSATALAISLVAGSVPLLGLVCGVIAVAALMELAMTWFSDLPGSAREITQ